MADYYTHNDPRRKGNDQYIDEYSGGSAKWIWAAIVLIAFVALIALGGEMFGKIRTVLPDSQGRPIPGLDLDNPEMRVIKEAMRRIEASRQRIRNARIREKQRIAALVVEKEKSAQRNHCDFC